MGRRVRPAVDRTVVAAYGVTRDGQPLSYNRAPAADLAPWIGRLYVARVSLPNDRTLSCALFNESAMLRIQLSGSWNFLTADGAVPCGPAALLFGPHTRRLPLSVTGSFVSIGYSLRPGTLPLLQGPTPNECLDRVVPPTRLDLAIQRLIARPDPEMSDEDLLQILEDRLRCWVEAHGSRRPDPITAQFEQVAFTNPKMPIAEFAEQCRIGERTLERIIRRDYGMAPKQVLKRARALDMASVLRGVADADEAQELELRYYDQSHLIHEFEELFAMSPKEFEATPQPLMTLTLEARQARRLEMLERIAPGALRPWQ